MRTGIVSIVNNYRSCHPPDRWHSVLDIHIKTPGTVFPQKFESPSALRVFKYHATRHGARYKTRALEPGCHYSINGQREACHGPSDS